MHIDFMCYFTSATGVVRVFCGRRFLLHACFNKFHAIFFLQYDLRHSKHWEFQVHPDVLILPSRLNALAKDVFGTLVVNPGPLTRGVGGGTYAQLAIHPVKEADLRASIVQQNTSSGAQSGAVPPADAYPHNVAGRTAVTISKI